MLPFNWSFKILLVIDLKLTETKWDKAGDGRAAYLHSRTMSRKHIWCQRTWNCNSTIKQLQLRCRFGCWCSAEFVGANAFLGFDLGWRSYYTTLTDSRRIQSSIWASKQYQTIIKVILMANKWWSMRLGWGPGTGGSENCSCKQKCFKCIQMHAWSTNKVL